ncbi:hypothetical protein GYMLUDRAFT_181075, partial [Collybiopsis luxurians FD-317 M1]
IGGVYARHPGWEHSLQQINLAHSEVVDHLQRVEWKGDLVAEYCDSEIGCVRGQEAAKSNFLTKSSLELSNL